MPWTPDPSLITVTVGTKVSYCYTVMNMGVVTYTTHNLDDSEIGPILSDFPFDLAPMASAFVTVTIPVSKPGLLTNIGYWIAAPVGGPVITATDVAMVDVLPGTEDGGAGPAGCSDGQDNDGDGLTDCGDPDCQGAPPCIAAAPVLGPRGFIIAALVLLTVGGVALTLQRRAA